VGNFIIFTHQQILLGKPNQGKRSGQVMWHAGERGGTCVGFWWESQKERAHLKDEGVNGSMGSKWTVGRLSRVVWIGSTWLKIASFVGSCECGDEPSGFVAQLFNMLFSDITYRLHEESAT
jgi:hypothetical protein